MELQEQLELFEHSESDKILEAIHTEVREQIRKCMDDDEMREIEPGQNLGIINFLQNTLGPK